MLRPLPADPATIRKYANWFLIYGIALALLGAVAIIAPGIATLAASVLIGWVLLASGVFGLFAVFRAGSSAPGLWWNALTAVVYVLAGVALLWNPIAGALTLTIILAAYLLATGATKIAMAIGYRSTIPNAWGWMLVSGLLDVVLGGLIVSGLPGSTIWVLGLLVGISLLFTGLTLVVTALHCRKMVSGQSAPRAA